MNSFLYSIVAFLLLGAMGMAIANRKESVLSRQQRWMKFGTYVVITAAVLGSIFFNCLRAVVLIIFSFGIYELWHTAHMKNGRSNLFFSLFFFALFTFGLWRFSILFTPSFQLFVYLQVLLFDAFSQIAGQLFGKHQLVAKISPAKTVEGVMGGFSFSIISSLLLANWLHISVVAALVLALITAVSSFAGDLTASYYKRKMGVKDFSNFLPGQGGFLDRFDSLLLTGFVYFLLYLLNFLSFLSTQLSVAFIIAQ